MKRLLLVAIVLAITIPNMASAQDDPQATADAIHDEINALETQVAEIEATLTPVVESDTAETTLWGEAPELPKGEDGEVSIVAIAAWDSVVPFVVRNNTDDPVYLTGLEGVARNAAGDLVSTSSHSYRVSILVQPDQLAVGWTYMSDPVGPDDTLDLEPEYSTDPDDVYDVDLTISELELTADGIVGIAVNDSGVGMEFGGQVAGICFNTEGVMTGYLNGYLNDGDLEPGDDSPFSAEFDYPGEYDADITALDQCEFYLVGAFFNVL